MAYWLCTLEFFLRCTTRDLKENVLRVSPNPSSRLEGGVVTRIGDFATGKIFDFGDLLTYSLTDVEHFWNIP